MKKIILAASLLISVGGFAQLGGKLAQKMIEKKAAEGIDESVMANVEMFINGDMSNPVTSIQDGTKSITFRCYVSEDANGLKYAYARQDFDYTFGVLIKSTENQTDKEFEGQTMFQESGDLETWKEVTKADGYLEFTIDNMTDVTRYFEDGSGSFLKDNIGLEVMMVSNCRIKTALNTQTVISKGEFSVQCDGNKGKWATSSLEDAITAYKSGRMYEGNTSSDVFNRMLSYTRNKWPNVEVVHLKVASTSPTDDDRLVSDIWVLVTEDGVCTSYNVAVWEDKYTLSLSNYVPQMAHDLSDAFCDRKEEIRNVK
jgi:hypothetical protein